MITVAVLGGLCLAGVLTYVATTPDDEHRHPSALFTYFIILITAAAVVTWVASHAERVGP